VPPQPIPTAPSYEAIDIEGFDPDALATSVKNASMEIRALRGGALLEATLRRLSFRDATLESGRLSLPVLSQGSMPKDQICLGFTLDGQGPGNLNGQEVLPGSVRFFAEGAELAYRTAPNVNWTTFHVDREVLQREANAVLGRPLPLPDRGWLNMVPTAAGIPLGQCIRDVLSVGSHGTAALTADSAYFRSALLAAYVRTLSEGLQLDLRPLQRRAAGRIRTVRRARDYLVANLDEPFNMARLCEITAMTERTLQYAFRDVYGLSPHAWFQTMRLNEVHRELRARAPGDARIAEIAMRWGFTHLGRFSTGYRRLFGERPSETLARH
jgi:AraC-like DNA-binding protein